VHDFPQCTNVVGVCTKWN